MPDKRYEKLVKAQLVMPRSRDTLGNFLEKYVEQMSGSKNTLDNYIASKDCLIAFCGFDCKPETIRCQDAMQCKEYLKTSGRIDGKGGYGQNSVRKKLSIRSRFTEPLLKIDLCDFAEMS